jgi:hypothetical protein
VDVIQMLHDRCKELVEFWRHCSNRCYGLDPQRLRSWRLGFQQLGSGETFRRWGPSRRKLGHWGVPLKGIWSFPSLLPPSYHGVSSFAPSYTLSGDVMLHPQVQKQRRQPTMGGKPLKTWIKIILSSLELFISYILSQWWNANTLITNTFKSREIWNKNLDSY